VSLKKVQSNERRFQNSRYCKQNVRKKNLARTVVAGTGGRAVSQFHQRALEWHLRQNSDTVRSSFTDSTDITPSDVAKRRHQSVSTESRCTYVI